MATFAASGRLESRLSKTGLQPHGALAFAEEAPIFDLPLVCLFAAVGFVKTVKLYFIFCDFLRGPGHRNKLALIPPPPCAKQKRVREKEKPERESVCVCVCEREREKRRGDRVKRALAACRRALHLEGQKDRSPVSHARALALSSQHLPFFFNPNFPPSSTLSLSLSFLALVPSSPLPPSSWRQRPVPPPQKTWKRCRQ